jgi:hypothetical protein
MTKSGNKTRAQPRATRAGNKEKQTPPQKHHRKRQPAWGAGKGRGGVWGGREGRSGEGRVTADCKNNSL